MWKRIPHLMQQHMTPRKRVQINKPKHFTIYKTEQEKNSKCKKRTSGEDD